jgi:hypothetical protein
MNQVDGCCQHGELLDKYCPECDKEDREAEKKEFNPQEGDKILVSVDRSLLLPRIFLYMDRHGRCACVHSDDDEIYNNGSLRFRVVIWPYAKPLPAKLPEFVQGDPVIVWDLGGRKLIRIVCSVTEDGKVECYHEGSFESVPPYLMPIVWCNYKPLPGYDYGGRDVWGSENKK